MVGIICSFRVIFMPPIWRHIWELPVLRYHRIRVNYPYPFLGVSFWGILHGFIRQNYDKTGQIVTLFSSLW